MKNHAWIVAEPALGAYDPKCLQWEEREVPEVREGHVLIRTKLLSIDPTSRNWLKLDPATTYIPIAVGDVMIGAAVGEVVESRAEGFEPGDLVSGMWGWEEYSLATPEYLQRHDRDDRIPDEAYVSVFSHIGRAAAFGLMEIGRLKSSDTVVVSAAAGATGSIAVQLAKAKGCRVIGIAGGEHKCRYVVEDLGADDAIDYRAVDVREALAEKCPQGVDLFFDNVGGAVLDAVLANMAWNCRIVVCGAMSQYDLPNPDAAYGCTNLHLLMYKCARMEGFVAGAYTGRYAEFDDILRPLYIDGSIVARSHIVDGLDKAPESISLLLDGKNNGKLMVRV
ncbi:NADP-dependent oxidoreductase [Streptomyces violens]|uniref:NADP-dependent oxidoreductase n=1 Tax=Streptomyces violens TaxID=66377 RepID=UPI0004C12F88|nr:NADP-dependent oxidoreductase [Streptomyces violens]